MLPTGPAPAGASATGAQLARFLVPLALTAIVQGLNGQFFNAGMARVPRPTETLAAFGLAYGITDFLASPLSQVRQLGLVLATDRSSLVRVRAFALGVGAALSALLLLLGLSPLGTRVVGGLHGVEPGLMAVVLQALCALAPVPFLEAWIRLNSGLLLQVRRTEVVSVATVAGIVASAAAVVALLRASWVQRLPIALPILALYAGYAASGAILAHGCRRHVRDVLQPGAGAGLSLAYVVRFFWPLALVMTIQGLSRPLINLFVSRGPDGAESLAVLAVVYPLANLAYGWVNEVRSLPAAFRAAADALPRIRRFAVACGLLSSGLMLALFWTPVRTLILEEWIGIEPQLAELCAAPLMLFSFFPLAVMVRAYMNGIALVEHRTQALAPSGPARVGAILLVLLTLPALVPLPGATLGVAALLAGFVVEAMAVTAGLRRLRPASQPTD